jgi:hypothetical protein
MFQIRTNNRKAISVVMTTMIILVASVVLGTGVVIYGTSLFQTGGQQQSIASQGLKLWINSTTQTVSVPASVNYAWGAAAVRNNGDTLVSVNTIQIRGATVPFSSWFVDSNQVDMNAGTNFQSQLNLTKTDTRGNVIGTVGTGGGITAGSSVCAQSLRNSSPYTTFQIDEDNFAGTNTALCFVQATGPVALTPGQKMIVYFQIPNGVLGPIDSGSAVTVNMYAGNVGGPTTVQVGNP